MKFFLTIYVCSVIAQQCTELPIEKQIESLRLYPSFTCEKVDQPEA
jgi:hypothetical protein